jgi:hypothetical protein
MTPAIMHTVLRNESTDLSDNTQMSSEMIGNLFEKKYQIFLFELILSSIKIKTDLSLITNVSFSEKSHQRDLRLVCQFNVNKGNRFLGTICALVLTGAE